MALARTRPAWAPDLALRSEGLAVGRGGRPVVAGVTFTLHAGQALEVRGPNGAGKSTLLRALAGLLRPEAGRVTLTHGRPDAVLAEQAHHLGHLDGLKGALTAAESLAFSAGLLGTGDAPGLSPVEALEALGLGSLAGLPVGFLSAGQRRRVALARLLVAPRPLWVLDEPTTALDAGAQATLAALMEQHLAANGLVVAATHGPLGLSGALSLQLRPA